jgi:hypothetical protein
MSFSCLQTSNQKHNTAQARKRTDDSPIAGARDPQCFTLDLPAAMQTEGRQPYAIHRVGTNVHAVPTEIEFFDKFGTRGDEISGTGPFVLGLECPRAAWNGNIAGS